MHMQIDFEILQEAFVEGQITIEQFVEVLIDNFGYLQTKKILKKNLKLAKRHELNRKN